MDISNPGYKYSELLSLRKIEAEFWSSLEKNLNQSKSLDKVNLRPLIKLQKSLNNVLMKMIAQTAAPTPFVDDMDKMKLHLVAPISSMMLDVDEAEGPRKE